MKPVSISAVLPSKCLMITTNVKVCMLKKTLCFNELHYEKYLTDSPRK